MAASPSLSKPGATGTLELIESLDTPGTSRSAEATCVEAHRVAPAVPAALSQAAAMVSFPAAPVPRPLAAGERVELWLQLAPPERDAPDDADAGDESDWDVRPARVTAATAEAIVLQTGGWQLEGGHAQAGARAVVRRFDPHGLAEWEGQIGTQEAAGHLDAASLPALHTSRETAMVIRLRPGEGDGRLHQRRRSPRLPVDLAPVRLTPLGGEPPAPQVSQGQQALQPARQLTLRIVSSPPPPPPLRPLPAAQGEEHLGQIGPMDAGDVDDADDAEALDSSLLPVARLTDVSATGAGVVVDYPLPAGTTVSLEFDLPGETTPFAVRGRVVEPAVPIHGDVQPQADGLPGFRRGIEFIGTAANREARRLAAALSRLLLSDSSSGW